MAVKSRRYGMAPAQISVFLTQKPSTENGINRATTLFLAWQGAPGWAHLQQPQIQPIVGPQQPVSSWISSLSTGEDSSIIQDSGSVLNITNSARVLANIYTGIDDNGGSHRGCLSILVFSLMSSMLWLRWHTVIWLVIA